MYLCEIIKREKFLLERGAHKRDALLIVTEGSFEFEICGKKYTARKNDIAFFKKNTEFTRRVLAPIKCLYIQSDGALNQIPGLLRCDDDARKNNTIIHLAAAMRAGDELLINHYISDILISVKNRHPAQDRRMLALTDYIDKNYPKPLTLGELSAQANMSAQGLISAFRRATGVTPIEYLLRVRLRRAREYLRDTDFTVDEIAALCGFENIYYFSNTFKKRCGISPTGYREQLLL